MNTVQIRLYDLFRNELKLTDDKAAAFVAAMEDIIEFEVKDGNDNHVTKDDIHKLELKIEQSNLKIEQSKNDIYKAVFLTGLLQFLGILGGVIAIVKFMK
jgi:glycyl-tRNA synthetase alpha subunit